VAGAALRPIERMRSRASSISALSGDRLPLPPSEDEVRRLGETLNDMLDRLDAALRRERHFVAEAGHELRTPLALLRMELDLALARPRGAPELRSALASAGEEVDRLTRLSEALLDATEPDRTDHSRATVDVVALLQAVAARFGAAFSTAGRSVTVAGAAPLCVRADGDRLDRALTNLVDNALRHGAGSLRLDAAARGDTVVVSVRDEGPGPEPAEGHGGGLGLTIVRTIVERDGGQVQVAGCEDPPGTVVTIELPAAPAT
jgi:signal transduction histidine kinase